jgi:hypothetical protein
MIHETFTDYIILRKKEKNDPLERYDLDDDKYKAFK